MSVAAFRAADPRRRVLVVGGGVTGISAAIELAEAGCGVLLVERQPHLGGRVAAMHQYFPKLCPPLCGLELNLRRLRSGPGIDCLTLAEVTHITDLGSHLVARVRVAPRFVDERCTACGDCVKVCPAARVSTLDYGLGRTRAIYLSHPAAYPSRYVIDPAACEGPSCGRCVAACRAGAIDLAARPRELTVEVAAVIHATGWEPYDAGALAELGFGAHPDVLTNVMFERMAAPSGPTGGRILCPSHGRAPRSVAFVQCAGSRDDAHLPYCSGLCCLASAKQARYVRQALPEAEISVHYIDRRAAGSNELFLAETERDEQTRYVQGKVARVDVSGRVPIIEYEDVRECRLDRRAVDLVVLATGMVPTVATTPAQRVLPRDPNGFLSRQPLRAQLAAGCAREPMDVAASVRDAASAALLVLGMVRSGQRTAPEARRDGGTA